MEFDYGQEIQYMLNLLVSSSFAKNECSLSCEEHMATPIFDQSCAFAGISDEMALILLSKSRAFRWGK